MTRRSRALLFVMNFRFCTALGLIASLPQLQAIHDQADPITKSQLDDLAAYFRSQSDIINKGLSTGAAQLFITAMMPDLNKITNTELPQTEYGECHSRCTPPAFWKDLCFIGNLDIGGNDSGISLNIALALVLGSFFAHKYGTESTEYNYCFTHD